MYAHTCVKLMCKAIARPYTSQLLAKVAKRTARWNARIQHLGLVDRICAPSVQKHGAITYLQKHRMVSCGKLLQAFLARSASEGAGADMLVACFIFGSVLRSFVVVGKLPASEETTEDFVRFSSF